MLSLIQTPGGHKKCLYQKKVRIKRVEFSENVRASFPQGQSKLSIIIILSSWCP